MLKTSHPAIRRLKQEDDAQPSIHGTRVWRSSFMLIDYLKKHPPARARKVMDVGCGWGMAGIFCAKHFGSKVLAVDADRDVFPYLLANAEANGVKVQPVRSRFENITRKQLKGVDVLIAADICFWDELVDIVFNLVRRAVQAGVRTIIIGDPERSTFLDMAERCEEVFDAELLEWGINRPLPARGTLMVLEND